MKAWQAKKHAVTVIGSQLGAAVDACSLATAGFPVCGVVSDPATLQQLRRGNCDTAEPGLNSGLRDRQIDGLLRYTDNLEPALQNSRVSLVWTDPGQTESDPLNSAALLRSLRELGAALATQTGYHLVVVRSTVAPGTLTNAILPVLEHASGKRAGVDFGLAYSPEVIRPGTALADYANPVRTLLGALDRKSNDQARSLFNWRLGQLCEQSLATAEATRFADLLWQSAKLRFSAELDQLCQLTGASRAALVDAFKRDTKQNISACYIVADCPQPELEQAGLAALVRGWDPMSEACEGRQINALRLVG